MRGLALRPPLHCYGFGISFSASQIAEIMYSDPQAQTTPSEPACSMAVFTPSATLAQAHTGRL